MEINCITGEITDLLPIATEITQRTKDISEDVSWRAANVLATATYEKDRADGLAKLELAGLTPAQAEAVARKKP